MIVGGGSAGISVASRLQHKGFDDIGLIDPAQMPTTSRCGHSWAAAGRPLPIPAAHGPISFRRGGRGSRSPPPTSTLATSTSPSRPRTLTHDHLVACPGIQLDFDKIPGMSAALDTPSVSTDYTTDSPQDVVADP